MHFMDFLCDSVSWSKRMTSRFLSCYKAKSIAVPNMSTRNWVVVTQQPSWFDWPWTDHIGFQTDRTSDLSCDMRLNDYVATMRGLTSVVQSYQANVSPVVSHCSTLTSYVYYIIRTTHCTLCPTRASTKTRWRSQTVASIQVNLGVYPLLSLSSFPLPPTPPLSNPLFSSFLSPSFLPLPPLQFS